MWPPKLVRPYFGRLVCNHRKLFSVLFPSRQKVVCSRGFTHPHFNFTLVLNWKITHNYIYIVIHNNLVHSTLTFIHISLIHSNLIHTHKSVIHTHQSLIHISFIHRYTSLIHRYRLGNFHYALGGLLELWLPPEAKRALTKSASCRG
jgi:hypothetical protein